MVKLIYTDGQSMMGAMMKNKWIALILGLCLLLSMNFMPVDAMEVIEISGSRLEGPKLLSECPPIPNTPNFTFSYGTALLNVSPAPIGTAILAKSPRGDVVGCTVITTTGYYGAMYIYGEDTSVSPVIPGMRPGETVSFFVDNISGTASQQLTYSNDRDLHEINLTATGESAPLANFSADKISGAAPLLVQFTNQTIGVVTGWLWNFGDGETSTLQNPSHSYVSKGVYTVSLTAYGTPENTTETKTNCITAYDSAIANFSASPLSGIAPLGVDFSNTSTGDYSNYSWTFGDGSTSTQANPGHTYIASGNYTVSLTVYGLGSSDLETKTDYITVYQPVIASFFAIPTNGMAPLLVSFTNTSTGDFDTYNWDFGDGDSSTEQNPNHLYTSNGIYTVTLSVDGNGGTEEETKIEYIVVSNQNYVFLPLLLK
jgi:PKD repeat protein